MNEVAEACGFSKPSLYHYYRDKYSCWSRSPRTTSRASQALVAEVEARETLRARGSACAS